MGDGWRLDAFFVLGVTRFSSFFLSVVRNLRMKIRIWRTSWTS